MSSPASLSHKPTSSALLRLGTVLITIAKSSTAIDSPPGKKLTTEGESVVKEGR